MKALLTAKFLSILIERYMYCICIVALFLLPAVWIIGDSVIFDAGKRALCRQSPTLGLDNHKVIWIGTPGMHWTELCPKIELLIEYPFPALLVIHLGGDDIASVSMIPLMTKIKKSLRYISKVLPDAYLVWSDILPRMVWPGNPVSMNNKRMRINRFGRETVRGLSNGNGRFIMHQHNYKTPGLFENDGIRLTEIGNDMFLNTLEEALRLFISSSSIYKYEPNQSE